MYEKGYLFCQKLSAFMWMRVWTLVYTGTSPLKTHYLLQSLSGVFSFESVLPEDREVQQPLLMY